ncbi:MAG: biosynthetic peptidoglycan transglycosylase [Lutibacter sp.]
MTNYFSGQILRFLSILIMQLSPSLKLQFTFIKQTISKSTEQIKYIPDHLINSLILIEDKRFKKHYGVDLYAILRAIIRNTTTKRLEGASTIVQQLIRNITNEREINIKRKMKEIILASLIDKVYSKDEILFAYFDTYRFENCIGIFTFCKYENYNLDNLSVNQAAEIAARFKYPILRKTNYVKYLKRVRIIEIKTTPKN